MQIKLKNGGMTAPCECSFEKRNDRYIVYQENRIEYSLFEDDLSANIRSSLDLEFDTIDVGKVKYTLIIEGEHTSIKVESAKGYCIERDVILTDSERQFVVTDLL